jgi:glycerol-3-phosphate dehydrogenase
LTEREVAYLKEREWARQPADVLWRRTKCGLHMSESERARAEEAIARLL